MWSSSPDPGSQRKTFGVCKGRFDRSWSRELFFLTLAACFGELGPARDIAAGLQRFTVGSVKFATLCGLLVICSLGATRAQDIDFTPYTRAAEYCRGDVARPMALSPDKRVLCLDGWIASGQDVSLANNLEDGGYFIVRGAGGDIATTIALASLVGEKHATVVVDDYCLETCAAYLLIASAQAFVLKDSLVAWTYIRSGPDDCTEFVETPDFGPRRSPLGPCVDPIFEGRSEYLELIRLKDRFYKERIISPPYLEPPESVTVQRALKRKLEATGRFPEVYWTWNPRYYASSIRTKILYEAYPRSQGEVDAVVARIHLPYPVIYDP